MKIKIITLLTVALSATPLIASEPEVVEIALGQVYRDSEINKKFGLSVEGDLERIYINAALQPKFIYLPNERAIKSVLSGQYDALDLRIGSLEQEESLLKIDVPLAYMEIYLFTIGDEYYEDLSQLSDKVVVSHHGTRYVKKLKNYKKLHLVQSQKQGALMLSKGRADVWLAPKVMFEALNGGFSNIKLASPAISREPLYHFIHVSKAHLRPQLEESSKAFMQDRAKQQQASD
ncbi:substrate-binding periplasmic protein [Vibrio ostreicida]|uniref:substrate-binding periplasmic protein n=1 Tax=Vibrio ostreicida TaxID=526588 RepID=UPI003B5B088A